MSIIVDRTKECRDIFQAVYPGREYKLLPFLGVRWLVDHKTGLSQLGPDNPNPVQDVDLDGPTLVDRFARSPAMPPAGLGTGGRAPYHILVRRDAAATAEQLLPLTVQGCHSRGYNGRSWALAFVGETPTDAQYRRIVEVSAILLPANGGLWNTGHTELPGASGDPNKRCPGPGLLPDQVASDAVRAMPFDWDTWSNDRIRSAIQAAGFVL